MKNGGGLIMVEFELSNGGYAWIDNVIIENVYKIVLDNSEEKKLVEIYDKNGDVSACANMSYVDEVGYCEYSSIGEVDESTRKIIYSY